MAEAVAQRIALRAEWLEARLPTIAAWLLGFVPVTALAFQGGGYDAVVRSQAGIAVWWILALGFLAGAIVPALPSRRAGLAVALLAALGLWTWIGMAGSESPERTLGEVARIATYLGVLLLGVTTLDRRRAPTVVIGIASAITLVAGLAVLARLQPGPFPHNATGSFLPIAQHRLNWPLNYWNGLAALCALGVPLLLTIAATHRRVAVRATAAAALPVVALCNSLTVSRGGIVAIAIAVCVLFVAAPMRPQLFASLALTGAASAILIAAAAQREFVDRDLTSAAALHQGDELTVVLLVVAAGAGLIQAGLALLEPLRLSGTVGFSGARALAWLRRRPAAAVGAVLVAVIALALVAGLPGRLSSAWSDFKSPQQQRELTENYDASRLGSLSSNGRYQLWRSAVDSMVAHPLLGTGAGTYEFVWLRDATSRRTVRDAHSLYLELGAETGVLGLLLGLAFVLALATAARDLRRLDVRSRLTLAAALAGLSAFAFSAAVDWVWELPAIAVAAMLLAAVALTAGRAPGRHAETALPRRLVVAAATLVPIGVLAVVLAGAGSLEQSRADARAGNLPGALEHAAAAHAITPAAATPLLQSALVREEAGDLRGAVSDARAAVRREPLNWRTWLVLSRLEARTGHPTASVAAFRRARALNPRHTAFQR